MGHSITFNGSGTTGPSGQTLSYAWNFGDGATGTGVSPTHSYATAGTYTVTLTVTDGVGGSSTSTTTATILTAPVASAGGPIPETSVSQSPLIARGPQVRQARR